MKDWIPAYVGDVDLTTATSSGCAAVARVEAARHAASESASVAGRGANEARLGLAILGRVSLRGIKRREFGRTSRT